MPSKYSSRNNGHESRSEKERNQAQARLRHGLVRDSSVVGGGGGGGACARAGRGRLGASGRCGCVGSGVTENIVEVSALAADTGLELVGILALRETVDGTVVVVLVNRRVFAALVQGIGDIATNDGSAGGVGGWDLPDAAAAGCAGCADGGGSGRHFG